MIDSKDISVVIQGAVDKYHTPLCIKSIRKYLPKSEIILSTWNGLDILKLDYDILVTNDDIGGVKDMATPFVNNLNRQIISTSFGIKKANCKYTLKIRSDLIFQNTNFLKYFDKFPTRDDKYLVFEHRLIFSSYFFKKYVGTKNSSIQPVPFHMSDWMIFGFTSDVKKIFDVDLVEEPEFTNYFLCDSRYELKKKLLGSMHQYAPEQYLFYTSIKNNIAHITNIPDFSNMMDYTIANISFYENIVINNCIILDPDQIVFYNAKNGIDPYRLYSRSIYFLPGFIYEGLYSNKVFLEDYKKYLDNKYPINFKIHIRSLLYKLISKIAQGVIKFLN